MPVCMANYWRRGEYQRLHERQEPRLYEYRELRDVHNTILHLSEDTEHEVMNCPDTVCFDDERANDSGESFEWVFTSKRHNGKAVLNDMRCTYQAKDGGEANATRLQHFALGTASSQPWHIG